MSGGRGRVAAVAMLATALSACAEVGQPSELTATPVPEAQTLGDDDRSAAGEGEPAAHADPGAAGTSPADAADGASEDGAPGDGDAGGTSRDAERAAFLYEHVDGAVAFDHLTVDLIGDGTPELLVSAITPAGVLELTLAAWDGHAYVAVGSVTGGAPQRLGAPLARDVTGNGREDAVAPFLDDRGPAVLLATVASDGDLRIPSTCPLASPKPERMRVKNTRAMEAFTLTCGGDAKVTTPLLRWQDGLFVSTAETSPIAAPPPAVAGERGGATEPPRSRASEPPRDRVAADGRSGAAGNAGSSAAGDRPQRGNAGQAGGRDDPAGASGRNGRGRDHAPGQQRGDTDDDAGDQAARGGGSGRDDAPGRG
ncbi:hypothetical protein [Egicoccus sp. AB-alg2]|uniref:hypothetical protein n=1 Tax=Egicoccus sp. AB-alg2 TaxID=3242693 RepID=UPI00359E7213